MKNSILLLSCVAIATVTIPRLAIADSPRHFLQEALQGDNAEIMLGGLAAERARSPRVKEYGRMLASDHHDAREEVIRVGQRMGVRRNRDLAPEAKDERDRLQNLDGREFDREFIRYMIQDHRKDVADFRDEAREDHGPVSALAERQLPTLEKHLEMAMDLDRGGDRGGMDRARRDSSGNDDRYRDSDRGPDRNGRDMDQPTGNPYGNDRDKPNR
ncbi:MAG: DUF4142 domain-containing protein [Pseudomonadota bacterium]